ncbi:MAG TPA: roadblock/LC7 domain-containing protein [Anaeromyxobacteraceae bacterium]|nr:roadblock/LC7 domain-containing protein [Anaeromyxobacteraceae bacterium]
MNDVLAQLNAVPGVLGSLVSDREGQLLAHAFPPTFDAGQLQRAAAVLAERAPALDSALGKVGLADFRYAGARVVVKGIGGGRLVFLCAPAVNLPFLGMSATAVVPKLERLVRERPAGTDADAAGANGGALHALVQRVDDRLAQSGPDRFKLRGQIALKAGFALDLVDAGTPDDAERLAKLRAAVLAVLGQIP